MAACGPAPVALDPARDHAVAFTAVDAIYSAQLGTYAEAFSGYGGNMPLTLMHIVISSTPHLCDDLNNVYVAPDSSRLLLEGYVDGDATQVVPSSTWSQTYTDLPREITQLHECQAMFYGYDDKGITQVAVAMTSGTATFATVGDPNLGHIGLDFDMVPQLGGSDVHLSDPNITGSYCLH